MIECGGCKQTKDEEDFCKSSVRKTGRQYNCKECQNKASIDRYHTKLAKDPSYKTKKSEYDKKRRAAEGEKLREYDRLRSKEPSRKASHAEASRRRKMIVKQQTPAWADKESIANLYKLAQKWSGLFGVNYHVDHIIPLRGENICGLHVENNLQLLEANLNVAKSNRFELNRKNYR